jgi:SET domain-containing protein
MLLPILFIAPSEKGGRGVFASESIAVNTVLEISPVIAFSAKDRAAIEQSRLHDYIFEWGKTRKMGALALGYISMYNHDYSANCEYEMDFEAGTMTIRAIKPIAKGQELCINYNADPEDKTLVWFHKNEKSRK